MNRRKFVLSWGRKLFFGLGLPLFLFIALNYFQSLIYPRTPLSAVYFISTYIGHYGLLTSLIYFLLFAPIVFIFNSYYFSRAWAALLVVLAGFILFVDSMVFSQYRFHINGFILELLFGGAARDIFSFPPVVYLIVGCVFFVLTVSFWIRGDSVWRGMQRRFSNPNKNWYFLVIIFSLMVSHGLHIYADAVGEGSITRLAQLFPLHYPATAKRAMKKLGFKTEGKQFKSESVGSDFTYPKSKMKCFGAGQKNILFIVVDSWRFDQLNEEVTPNLSHYAQHGLLFNNHHSGSNNTRGGIFSLFYGLPGTYWSVAFNNRTSPVMIDEALAKGYDFGIFSSAALTSPEFDKTVFINVPLTRLGSPTDSAVKRDQKVNEDWKKWIDERHKAESQNPFFGFLFYDAPHSYESPPTNVEKFQPIASGMNYIALNNSTDPIPYLNLHHKSVSFVDGLIKEVIDDLHKKELLEETIVVITGDHGQELNDNKLNYWGHNSNYSKYQIKVPLLILWPDKNPKVTDFYTSHYDIVPTLMKGHWGCENPSKEFSFGDSLFAPKEQNWHLAGSYNDYGIIDYDKNLIVSIDPIGNYDVTDLELKHQSKIKAQESLILKILKELTYFRK